MPRESTAKNWNLTWNNYPADWLQIWNNGLRDLGALHYNHNYWILAKETGESGTPHLQGFVQFETAVPFRHVRQLAPAHFETTRKLRRMVLYCKKGIQAHAEWERSGERGPNYGVLADFVEHGTPRFPQETQGKRNDLSDFRAHVQETFDSGGTFTTRQARDLFPEIAAKYPAFVAATISDFAPKLEVERHELRPWQQNLYQKLQLPSNRREIIFVIDRRGNQGKSWFAQYYCWLHPETAVRLTPGKHENLTYSMTEDTKVFFFDVPRSRMQHLLIYMLEQIKDQEIQSSKYVPRNITFRNVPHVVVLANEPPDYSMMSTDRVTVIDL